MKYIFIESCQECPYTSRFNATDYYCTKLTKLILRSGFVPKLPKKINYIPTKGFLKECPLQNK